MTSFAAITSPVQDAAINQDGGNFSKFKVLRKNQKPLELYDK